MPYHNVIILISAQILLKLLSSASFIEDLTLREPCLIWRGRSPFLTLTGVGARRHVPRQRMISLRIMRHCAEIPGGARGEQDIEMKAGSSSQLGRCRDVLIDHMLVTEEVHRNTHTHPQMDSVSVET